MDPWWSSSTPGCCALGRTDRLLDGITGDVCRTDGVIDLDPAHGTFVAGVIRQVTPHARVHVVRTFDASDRCPDSSAARGVVEAHRVIAANGGRASSTCPGVAARRVGLHPWRPHLPCHSFSTTDDVAVVAAAGNAGLSRPWFPAASEGVVAVGALALDADVLRGANSSNRGDAVDYSAVGEGVNSAFVRGTVRAIGQTAPGGWTWSNDDPFALWSGTSFAAPQVAARVAALLAEVPDESAGTVVKLLADDPTAVDLDGYGTALRIL